MQPERIELRASSLSISEDGVAELTHQRPHRRNAISSDLIRDYDAVLSRIEGDSSIRALILTGAGGFFCAGADLNVGGEDGVSGMPDKANWAYLTTREFHTWFSRVRNLALPVIAAIDGGAIGAGAGLALAADFVLVSTRAYLCMAFARIGLIPDTGVLYTLPRLVGTAIAKDLLLTGRRVVAEEARQLGLVHSVHEPEALLPAAHAFARRFSGASLGAYGATKRLLNGSFDAPFALAGELEAHAQAGQVCSTYHGEAVARFLKGEKPLFDWDRPDPSA